MGGVDLKAGLVYRPEIDGLRAVAVLAVLLYHADASLLPGGFVGVDVFFVISGYLITRLLVSEWQRTGRIDFAAFYARRVRRLLPALAAMVLLVLFAMLLLMGRHAVLIEQTSASVVASLFFVSNIYFQMTTGGYFDEQSDTMPMLHLWSLAVEEQFYLVYPLLMLALLRFVPGAMTRRLAVLTVASLLLAEYWVNIYPDRAFFQMPARFWELGMGGMVALATSPSTSRPGDRWLLPVGFAAVLLACVFTASWGNFPGKSAIPAVVGSALVLLGVHRGATGGWAAAMLRSPAFVAMGLISYSLYLWHWPLLVLDDQSRLGAASTAWRLTLCLLAVVIAWCSWRFVETPFRQWRSSTLITLWAGAGATVTAVFLAFVAAQVNLVPAEALQIASAARVDQPSNMGECHFDHDSQVESLPPTSCESRPSQKPRVALWGDSHAFAWQPFVWRLADATGESAAAATMNSCIPSGKALSGADFGKIDACNHFNRLALDWLESSVVETLVIGLRWPLGDSDQRPASVPLRRRIEGLDAALGRLPGVGRVLLIGPIPTLRRSAPDCIALGWEEDCTSTRAEFELSTRVVWRELQGLAKRHPSIELVDPADFFCGADQCLVSRDDYALFWDSNHVSTSAAREFADRFLRSPERYTVTSNTTATDD